MLHRVLLPHWVPNVFKLGIAIAVLFVVYVLFFRPAPQTKVAAETSSKTELEQMVERGVQLDNQIKVRQTTRDSLQQRFFYILAKTAGKKHNLNWRILYGLWMRESKMNPNAKGDGDRDSVGAFIAGTWRAFGLGQIHRQTAQFHVDKSLTSVRLLDPITNGFASAKILRDYMDLFGGSYIYGISAYQQGPSATAGQYKSRTQPGNYWQYVSDVLLYAAAVE